MQHETGGNTIKRATEQFAVYKENERLKAQNRELVEAANNLLHLHSCEQEGLASGQPTPQQWMEAVEKLSALTKGEL